MGADLLLQRDAELKALLSLYDEVAKRRQPAFVSVTGEAGAGKTSLLLAFEAALRGRPGAPLVSYGRALAADSINNPYEPFHEALADLVRDVNASDDAGFGRRITTAIAKSAPSWLRVLPVVGEVLSAVATTVRSYRTETEPTANERSSPLDTPNYQFWQLLIEIASARPIVILLDDLHWADQASLDLLFFLSQKLQDLPILVVAGHRPQAIDDASSYDTIHATILKIGQYLGLRTIALKPLTIDAISTLVAQRVESAPSREMVDWLLSQTSGNPLYLSEFITLLEERGAMRRTGSVVTLAPGWTEELTELPQKVESVVAWRLLSLPTSYRGILDVAAVVGPVFEGQEIAELGQLDSREVGAALSAMAQRWGLVRSILDTDPEAGDGYFFSHSVIRTYLLAQLRERALGEYRRLHGRRARILEAAAGHHFDTRCEILSHLRQAGLLRDALATASSLRDGAKAEGALPVALGFARQAVELVDAIDEPRGRIEARLALGCILLDGLKPHDALLTLTEAADIAAGSDELRSLRATVALRRARGYCLQRRWAEARRQIREADEDRELLDPDGLSELGIVELSACIHGLPRDCQRAERLARSAVETATSEGQRATAVRHDGLVELAQGRIDAALDRLRAAEPMVVSLGDAHGLYQTLIFRVFAQLAQLDLASCQATLERLRDVTSRSEIGVMTVNRVSGRVSGLTGDMVRAVESWKRFLLFDLEYASTMPNTRHWALSHFEASIEELATLGRPDLGLRLLDALRSSGTAELQKLEPPFGDYLDCYGRALLLGKPMRQQLQEDRLVRFTRDPSAQIVHNCLISDLDEYRRSHGLCLPAQP